MTLRPVGEEPVKVSLSTPAPAQRSTGLAEAGDDLEAPGCSGTTRVKASASQHADCGVYSICVEYHGVAGGERVGDRAHRRACGVVPRTDDADDAERLGHPGSA